MTGKQRMYGLPMENSSGIIMFYTIFIIVPESILERQRVASPFINEAQESLQLYRVLDPNTLG